MPRPFRSGQTRWIGWRTVGLFMEQIRVIKEMRERDRNNGRADIAIRPRYGIWENVPGAFSSNGGQDFKAVIEEFVRVAEPEAPDVPMPQKGWPTSGCLFDEMGKWSVAWRVLDAQYWGVPQRRKRIALVADFNGLNAGTILFDPQYRRKAERGTPDSSVRHTGGKSRPTVQPIAESVCGNTEQSESAGQATTGDAEDGTRGTSAVGFPLGFRPENVRCYDETATTLCNGTRPGFTTGVIEQRVFGISSFHSNCMLSDNLHSGIYEADTARTLDALQCGYPACNQGGGWR